MVRGHAFVAKKRIVLLGRTLWEGEEYRVGQACTNIKIYVMIFFLFFENWVGKRGLCKNL